MTVHRAIAQADAARDQSGDTGLRRPGGVTGRLLSLQRSAGNRAVTAALRSGALPVQGDWLDEAAGWVGEQASWVAEQASGAVGAIGDAVGGAVDTVGAAVGDAVGGAVDAVGDALDIRDNEELLDYQEDREALLEWRAEGMRGPENMRAPTGIGGFGAAYDPYGERMLIRLAGGVTFADSITFAGDFAVVTHPNPTAALTSFVGQVNRLPVADRRTAAEPYIWTDAEKTAFLTTFNTGVEDRWGGKHEFHSTKENWTDLGATVDVDAALHPGAKGDDEHMSMTAYKTPPGGAGNVGVVRSGSGGVAGLFSNSAQATDNTMVLNSPDVDPRSDNLLDYEGNFAPAGTDLDAAGEEQLNRIGATFRGGGPGCRICGVTITESSGGPMLTVEVTGATEADARARYHTIYDALVAGGNLDIAMRSVFRYTGEGDAYRVVAGDGVAQTVAEHEAGHMFGLGDEYATGDGSMIQGTGRAAGDTAKHDDLVKEMGLDGAVHENNDGIMSLGSVVRPQHYATFHWALGELTGISWALGPPEPVMPPGAGQMGDFPTPDPDTVTA